MEYSLNQKHIEINGRNLLGIQIRYDKMTTVFHKYPRKCAVHPLISLEITLNVGTLHTTYTGVLLIFVNIFINFLHNIFIIYLHVVYSIYHVQ